MSSRSHFTENEKQYIIENWGSLTADEIANELGRSSSGVRKVAKRIGCEMRKLKRWTAKEDSVLLNAKGRSLADVAKQLGRCLPECSNRAKMLGIKSWAWHRNGSKYKKRRGYTVIGFKRVDGGPSTPVFEHVAVMEKILGRDIEPPEVVHHINCKKSDNREDNLYLCRDSSHHALVHHSIEKCIPELMDLGIVVFIKEKGVYKVSKDIKDKLAKTL